MAGRIGRKERLEHMTTSPVLSRILLYYGTVADVLFHYLVWLLDFIESTGGKLIEGLRIFVMAWSLNTVAAMRDTGITRIAP